MDDAGVQPKKKDSSSSVASLNLPTDRPVFRLSCPSDMGVFTFTLPNKSTHCTQRYAQWAKLKGQTI